jgi:DNA-binding FadR family transcriptional regulator
MCADVEKNNHKDTVSLFEPIKRGSTVELVIERVKNLLLTSKLLPGDKLPSENVMANNLSVGRGSIREAMKILAAFGIVEIRRGDGTYISSSVSKPLFDALLFNMILSNPDKKKLAELRELIELGIAKVLIRNAEEEDIAEVEQEFRDMESKINLGETAPKLLARSDLNFHFALGKATRNEPIQTIYNFVLEYLTPSIEKTHENETTGKNALELHRNILKYLKERDLVKLNEAIEKSIHDWIDLF